MAINTHGLTIKGLKAACGETKFAPRGAVEMFYNLETGEVWAKFQASEQTYTVYEDKAVIPLGYTHQPMTMQELADLIQEKRTQRLMDSVYQQ